MNSDILFSIIIANYNYGRYVGDAIDSALAQDWPHVEVIVVDDGSTDDSADVIARYGDRIRAVFTKNRGQREANNTGFEISRGDAVIFLDSDDVLLPGLLREIASVWREGLSKVQVMMQRVDTQKRPNGGTVPKMALAPPPAQIRQWVDATFEYPTPPSSANAWSRRFLNAIFPLDGTHDAATDSTCIAMAPYMGDVITIPKPLVLYRMHGANDSTMTARDTNYSREVTRGMKRLQAAQNACRIRGVPPPTTDILFFGGNLLQFRVASLRLTPKAHPLPGDSRPRALFDALLLPFRPSFQRLSTRLMIVGWSVLTLLVPERFARFLITKRYS
ncbi:glycosyltransferase [Acetobacter sp. TBRC 12305]|uniref:Glycosyltransferase family 2 protein n=1 Tax=Acetobacter garciniae TaxID=2817435 RepID=A0A939HPS5_9PROT|nr:glycosyltransferase family A protein [Acetobacter garciniae]MBO1325159.1 glycosyltransferase family 2 protein [Acetobacter garciniae]MBX0344870.1 glycosyltransferase [Acetobacter garciniae]